MTWLFFVATLLIAPTSWGTEQTTLAHSTARLVTEYDAFVPGQSTALGLWIELEKDWHTYWQNPGDSGAPVRIVWKFPTENWQAAPLQHTTPLRLETGGITTFGYEKHVLFISDVAVPADTPVGSKATIQAEAEWLVCREICIPARFTFKITRPVVALEKVRPSAQAPLFAQARLALPIPAPPTRIVQSTSEQTIIEIAGWPADQQATDYFPFAGSGLQNAVPRFEAQNGTLRIVIATSDLTLSAPPTFSGLLTYKKAGASQLAAYNVQPATPPAPSAPLWQALIFAFLGGLILNLMPCVFPIISIKLLSLVKQNTGDRASIRWGNLAYAAGVIASFWVLAGLLVGLRQGGEAVGWGFQLQSPLFILFLSFLFVALALNFLGLYEIDWIDAGLGAHLTQRRGWQGSFFTGFLSTIVASPCTAPFMGVSIGYAVSQTTPIILLIFTFLGIGLAFPYLFLSLFPALVRFLPKPGAWMETLKQAMAFPLFATVIWLLYLLITNLGNLAGAVALFALLIFAMSFWAYQRAKSRPLWIRLTISVPLFLSSLVLACKVVAQPVVQTNVEATAESRGPIAWQKFSPERVQELTAQGQTVFIDFTAAWCLTCKVNERITFSDRSVQDFIREKNLAMLKADWTQRDPVITQTLESYGRIGVPFYLVFRPGQNRGQVLPEVLTPAIFKSAFP